MHSSILRHKVMTIPGLDNSGPLHWQSLWEHKFADCERIELGDWHAPDNQLWVERIAEAISAEPDPVLIAAHSLGCHAFAHWFARAGGVARTRVVGALLVAPPDLSDLRRDSRVAGFPDAPAFTARVPMTVVASDNDPYAKTSHVWRLSRQWDARFVNAGPFGHINADSGIGDWPYGQYLLAWPNRVRRDPRFEHKESAYRP